MPLLVPRPQTLHTCDYFSLWRLPARCNKKISILFSFVIYPILSNITQAARCRAPKGEGKLPTRTKQKGDERNPSPFRHFRQPCGTLRAERFEWLTRPELTGRSTPAAHKQPGCFSHSNPSIHVERPTRSGADGELRPEQRVPSTFQTRIVPGSAASRPKWSNGPVPIAQKR